ncbi:Glycogen debranching enzyme [Lamellibrachia satsuma]|nr:Glycogen debranching enzyme [Lamellibrachia satsuma]
MIIRYVVDAVLPVLFIKGICGSIVTIRVMLAKEFRCRVFVWAYRTSKMLTSWIVFFICVGRFIAVCFFAANEDDMHKTCRMCLHSSCPADLRGLQSLPGMAGYVNSPGNLRAHISDSFKCCRWKSSSFEHQRLYDCRSTRNVHALSPSQNFFWQDDVGDDGNATGDERNVRLPRHAHLHRASLIVFSGFSVQIGVNWKTGFVFGGNGHNCGTWMDKMGSSEAAGNKGIPATPRDGSAVELVGLCKSTVRWLHLMYEHGKYPYRGVEKLEDGNRVAVSFGDWDKLIQRNFEKYFWINTSPDPKTESAPGLINKRGIYKDVVGASQVWTDYQLRSNFPIALVVAPELVDPAHAWTALGQAEKYLLGPLGMKTLDPSDMQYCGSYNNSDETNGFNYHQGPEWVWPVGYFLRAKLHFAALDQNNPAHLSNTVLLVKRVLAHHNVQIHLSDWKSLPELTNENGIFCHDSCGAQAWSMGCILEVLYMLEHLSAFSTTL